MGSGSDRKVEMIGVNHIALEVGDIDEALGYYGRIFNFELRSRGGNMAFIDMGDQFLALSRVDAVTPPSERHFGLVVDDKAKTKDLAIEAGYDLVEGMGVTLRDPWGNLVQIVDYSEVQFSKTPAVLAGMGLTDLAKNASAIAELEEKGMGG